MPTCSQGCRSTSCPCLAEITASLHRLRCARELRGGQGRRDRPTDTALLSLSLPPFCSHPRTLQTGAAALRTQPLCTVPHRTRSSRSVLGSFFFFSCLFVQSGGAAVLPQLPGAQLGATDKPRQLLSSPSKLSSRLLAVAAVLATDGPAGLQKL